ncbi:DUF2798 domain-containing protein [Marinomonas sp. M1K-6]|jgi:hypothetical protein|uniref:DUF2798 domain-containing protein n=2 Tax=Marinomonas profundi TaxID=2726122 RepID=A0A847RCK1_9GAMM|nr:DUF2798 domain-containing protein [Marinomonas profundi]UDV03650.1 DUF2798 domain-containing protein [Marinomonas profundi]
MIPKKHLKIVTPLLMSILMVTIMTATITIINTGITEGFLERWGKAYLISWPIAFCIIFIFGKRIQTLSQKICSK